MEKSLNIQKAIEVEKEYLSITDNKEQDHFNLKERLEYLGYNLDSFHKDKIEYLFNQTKLEVRETTLDNLKTDTQNVIKNGEQVWFNIKTDRKWVFLGEEADYNSKYCADNKISILTLGHNGGVIATTPEDFNLVVIMKQHNALQFIQKNISDLLTKLGVENKIDGNDILVNGNKVSGCAETDYGEYIIYYFQISFRADLDLIQKVCNKKMNKIPMGISDFYPKINRENLIDEIKQWLQ